MRKGTKRHIPGGAFDPQQTLGAMEKLDDRRSVQVVSSVVLWLDGEPRGCITPTGKGEYFVYLLIGGGADDAVLALSMIEEACDISGKLERTSAADIQKMVRDYTKGETSGG